MTEPTAYRKELRERILTTALKEFFQRGLRAVRMDDIAKQLGISKRTLYEIFKDKEELLYECVKYSCEKEHEEILARREDCKADVMEMLVNFIQIRLASMTSANPAFFTELGRYKRVLDYLLAYRKVRGDDGKYFIGLAQQQGYIRTDIDMDLLGRIFQISVDNIMKTELFKQFELPIIFRNLLFVWMRGISTEKGINKIDMIINRLREQPPHQ